YEIIGRRLQIACDKLWKGLPKLITEGVIRRIGASLNSGKFDFSSTKARNLLVRMDTVYYTFIKV
ncbi:MAG: hypothetical protein ACYS9C_02980, partial [Planctomycetota bacterium]